MPNEIEIKYQVKDFKAVLSELNRREAKFLGRFHEHDQFFDTPSGELMSADRGLRLRITRTIQVGCMSEVISGGRPVSHGSDVPAMLTYKGPRRPDQKLKIRREIQFHVDDVRAATSMLKALGYLPCLVVPKRRAAYLLGECSVLLDELRGIGRFVEIEGPSRRSVEALCRKLGLCGPSVTKSYARLTVERRMRGRAK